MRSNQLSHSLEDESIIALRLGGNKEFSSAVAVGGDDDVLVGVVWGTEIAAVCLAPTDTVKWPAQSPNMFTRYP